MPRIKVSIVVLTLAATTVVACGGSGDDGNEGRGPASTRATEPSAATSASADGAVDAEVVERVETFVDSGRPTPAPLESPERTLVTTIRFPDAGGPYPLIVFAHGFNGHPRKFERLTAAWAEAGYVVAAPAFPLTNEDSPEQVIAAVADQPGDVSFVIDEMLRLNGTADDPLEGLIDPDRIGVGGLSLGAITTLSVTSNTCCRDERIDAAVSMAGTQFPFDGAFEFAGVPLLLLHGDADAVIPSDASTEIFGLAAAPRFLVTILGGGHFQPFEDIDDPADAMVQAVTTKFWDVYLRSPAGAVDDLIVEATVPGLTTVQHDAG